MANTLKFGNGEWYGKKDTILAYNDENYNYKPLPFSFDRASSGTVVNKAGLIETVGSGEPRIDFKDDAKGALLLEPQRSNLITYSEDFSNAYWTKTGASVVSDAAISPDGSLNASEIKGTGATIDNGLKNILTASTSADYTFSVFIKYNNWQYVYIADRGDAATHAATFDLVNNTVVGSSSLLDTKIESFANGWFRYSIKFARTNTTTFQLYTSFANSSHSIAPPTTTVSTSDSFYIYGAQLEEGYATSYIPTSGSAVTRLADTCTNGGNDQVFNNNTSVWFIDFSRFIYDSSIATKSIVLEDSSGAEQIRFHFDQPANTVRFRDALNSFSTIGGYISTLANTRKKVALKIDGTTLSVFSDGVKIGSDYTRPTGFDIDKMALYWGGTNVFDIKFYNTALTDNELQQLTTI